MKDGDGSHGLYPRIICLLTGVLRFETTHPVQPLRFCVLIRQLFARAIITTP